MCAGLQLSKAPVATATGLTETDFLRVGAQGKAERPGGWENILGKHLCFLCPS